MQVEETGSNPFQLDCNRLDERHLLNRLVAKLMGSARAAEVSHQFRNSANSFIDCENSKRFHAVVLNMTQHCVELIRNAIRDCAMWRRARSRIMQS
jgi:hypothetical protein